MEYGMYLIKKVEFRSQVCFFGKVVATYSDSNYVENDTLEH